MGKELDQATQSQIRNLEEKTGKSIEHWIKLIKAQKSDKHGELVAFLKSKHGIGHGYANLVVHLARGGAGADAPADDDLLAAQYAGPKAVLRPIYDELAKRIGKFGDDVEFAPKKAYVSLRRKKQFGLIQPSTATRVDVGINLKGKAAKGRLENSGSFNAMVSHRVRIESAKDIDAELVGWLRKAYDAAG